MAALIAGVTQAQALQAIQELLDTVTEHLAERHRVIVRDLGIFEVKCCKGKSSVQFKVGKELAESVGALRSRLNTHRQSHTAIAHEETQ